MPSPIIHIQQAELNESAALYNQSKYPHVAIIMCFYAALHYVEAYAAWRGDDIYTLYSGSNECDSSSDNVKSKKLTQHQRYQSYVDDISSDNEWDDLAVAYARLHTASETARYLKRIKNKNKTADQHFIDADFYMEKLQVVKTRLQISSIKARMEEN